MSELNIRVRDECGAEHTVWTGQGLERSAVVAARWELLLVTELHVVVHRPRYFSRVETTEATIEEVVLPGARDARLLMVGSRSPRQSARAS